MACDEHQCHGCVMLVLLVMLSLVSQSCYGLNTFGFDIHHRFSDPVKGMLGIEDVPLKGTPQYYAAMTHRDHVFRGRILAGPGHHTPLTFAAGNDTHRIASSGYLHFANVSVGTPPKWFLVALDTGSDLFWLPCDCISCAHGGYRTRNGTIIKFNTYHVDKSSTSNRVSCNNSTYCRQRQPCPIDGSNCLYRVDYLSAATSTSGFMVEDVLHLITDDDQTKEADTRIAFGCGQVQTGSFLTGAAPNGLFGLGTDNVSVPTILAKEGLISNSFSMCFGSDGAGRIRFGDSGSPDQRKTPFNIRKSNETYNITITQIIVEDSVSDLEFHAIFDTGTSYTYINDPAYTRLGEMYNSKVKGKRHSSQSPVSDIPFEYCYDISANQTVEVPFLNLTMKGGDDYYVIDPVVQVSSEEEGDLLCLGIQKSNSVNIIGQNFMTGYKIVFDRDNMNLGWKETNCYDDVPSETSPVNPPSHSPAVSPALAVNPLATSNSSINPPNRSFMIKPTFTMVVVLLQLIAIF